MKRETWASIMANYTSGLSSEQFERAVDMCVETEKQGDACGVWHAYATIGGYTCNCCVCVKAA